MTIDRLNPAAPQTTTANQSQTAKPTSAPTSQVGVQIDDAANRDALTLSKRLERLMSLANAASDSPIRASHVETLKREIENDSYAPQSNKITAKLIAYELALQPGHTNDGSTNT